MSWGVGEELVMTRRSREAGLTLCRKILVCGNSQDLGQCKIKFQRERFLKRKFWEKNRLQICSLWIVGPNLADKSSHLVDHFSVRSSFWRRLFLWRHEAVLTKTARSPEVSTKGRPHVNLLFTSLCDFRVRDTLSLFCEAVYKKMI